jgi:hypothetical protein
MRVERYSFGLSGSIVDGKLEINSSPQITIRPTRIICNIQKRGQVWISELSIDGINQLATELDCFQFSQGAYEEMIQEAMREYKLSTREELYQYLDDNDIELPDPCRADLPTIKKGKSVRLVGHGSLDYLFCISIIGTSYVE